MNERAESGAPGVPPLAGRIASRRSEILAAWEELSRGRAKARMLDRPILLDKIPDLLDRIAALTSEEGLEPTAAARPAGAPAVAHALDRLERGFDLEEVVDEYATLRRCILAAIGDAPLDAREVALLDGIVDGAMARAVTSYAAARERTLRAFDRISMAGTEAATAEDLLDSLLRVLVETTPAVDVAAVLLVEEGRLELRCAIGIEEDLVRGFSLPIGEGFAGAIAAERRPLEVRMATADTLLESESLRLRGVRALYGVPLLDGDELVGVVHMGSTTAFEFGEEDKLLLRSLAVRATALLQRARLLERERSAREEATRASEFRERLLAVVGHDLRNPLTAVRLSAGAILPRVPPDVARTVDRIARSAARMERIIADLVDAARARYDGNLSLARSPADLGEVIRAVVEEYRVTNPGREIALTAEGELGGEWDADRIAQLAGNLVQNALRHGSQSAPVSVSVRGGEKDVTLAVHNAGDPIPPDLAPHVFDPFRRGSGPSPGRDDPRSLGLGLFIVDVIVRAHGGQIAVDSTAEAGTTVSVRLPRTPPP